MEMAVEKASSGRFPIEEGLDEGNILGCKITILLTFNLQRNAFIIPFPQAHENYVNSWL